MTASLQVSSSPLPSPLELQAYSETSPEAFSLILKMADRELHRHAIEATESKTLQDMAKRSQPLAFAGLLVLLGGSIALAYFSPWAVAGWSINAGASIVALVKHTKTAHPIPDPTPPARNVQK